MRREIRPGYQAWYCDRCDTMVAFPRTWGLRQVNQQISYKSKIMCLPSEGPKFVPESQIPADGIILPGDDKFTLN